jgi:ribosome biogenesis GTPase / thiamine phosphate phosphatase
MTEEQRKKLSAELAAMDTQERNRLYRRASKMRRTKAKTHARSFARSLDEDMDDFEPKLGKKVTDVVLELMLQEKGDLDSRTVGKLQKGLAIEVGRKFCLARIDGKDIRCELPPDMARSQQSVLAVGDDVLAEDRNGAWLLRQVLPRRTSLSRPDPQNRNAERVIVANADAIVIVVSVVAPPLHPRIVDRYLIAVQRGGAQPILCVNKLDLIHSEQQGKEELGKLAPYEQLGIPIFRCSATDGTGIEDLRTVLRGQTCAFVGHSGVGKSSIVNAIRPEIAAKVGDVSSGYGRGTHTTTASSMYETPDGMRLIDTPGIRSFGLYKLSAEELAWYFPEFQEVGRCKYGNCTHTHEPGCVVKVASGKGIVHPVRYETYLRLLKSL